ncbi:hypothetical protein [Parendozoicomonas haliclonae]|uniref:Type 4 fimbrial biogenesis protein PilX N-terminal domain-containing protein n=1 Tax=Parendozoicomonas haliclonae TaxID=1960125 RepID=A0A1X7AGL5_9GAMM|nr:hypothetical protein [Parendozoicomonas haliclonae]SMA40326.1 hypothetical protein EHSB41UT_01176 [Parendozoicomonas haliclonae]
MNHFRQQGATLIVSLVMLLVVTLVGMSGLYDITVQNKQVRSIEESRLFYNEANTLFGQAMNKLLIDPGAEDVFSSSLSGTANTMVYSDDERCFGTGNDLTQPYSCRFLQTSVGFADGDKPDLDGPHGSYTLHYQFRTFTNE